ncbi:30S ribosomal protein S4 [Candidatus Microgenomates bacterium]|jgi:small subunit ribosomal protein S4|nr:MAG: 30S ribosomal protein S4 [Candidatus Microgenomates bacterium]
MPRYRGPKDKLSRREGVDIFGKGEKLKRLGVPPGGLRKRKKMSEYGLQLREKQKAKRIYGLRETQFKNYVNEAREQKGNTGEALISMLEKRLDNVVYRLGFAKSRPAARQLVTHKHIKVNGQTVYAPGYIVKKGETIQPDDTITNTPNFKEALEERKDLVPWLERQGTVGRVKDDPSLENYPEQVEPLRIIEFYY